MEKCKKWKIKWSLFPSRMPVLGVDVTVVFFPKHLEVKWGGGGIFAQGKICRDGYRPV
jgi:hypothetical protein